MEIKSLATGLDGISADMLLMCCPTILPYITHIINTAIATNTFPSMWKINKVCPLPKTNNPTSYIDIRGINIFSVLSKITEKIMCTQIHLFVEENDLLPKSQSGFKAGHSCTTALLNIIDDIVIASDNKKMTALVMLDYSRAFETIDHEIMIAMLKFIGFGENALAFMFSYLSGRYQYVETTKGRSKLLSVTQGIFQGSILGPSLFNIYISNIISKLKYCTYHLYADDLQLYYAFHPNDANMASTYMNEDINNIMNISEEHNLLINSKKSVLMIFNNTRKIQLNIRVKNDTLEQREDARNLGLEVDTKLKFTKHINTCIKRAFGSLKVIYPHRQLLDVNIKKILTETLVLSHFNFCDTVYGPFLTKLDQHRIEKVQRCCMRYIFMIGKYDSVTYKLKDLDWLTMDRRRLLHMMTLYHKILSSKTPPYLYRRMTFRCDVHNLNIRSRSLLSPPPHRTALFQKTFSFQIYKTMNSVSHSVLVLQPRTFKKKIREQLLYEQFCQLDLI